VPVGDGPAFEARRGPGETDLRAGEHLALGVEDRAAEHRSGLGRALYGHERQARGGQHPPEGAAKRTAGYEPGVGAHGHLGSGLFGIM
jgi:hypothetical protein